MGIGTSLGAFFETELDHHAGNELQALDNNEISPNEIMPQEPVEGEDPKIMEVVDSVKFDPRSDKQKMEMNPGEVHPFVFLKGMKGINTSRKDGDAIDFSPDTWLPPAIKRLDERI